MHGRIVGRDLGRGSSAIGRNIVGIVDPTALTTLHEVKSGWIRHRRLRFRYHGVYPIGKGDGLLIVFHSKIGALYIHFRLVEPDNQQVMRNRIPSRRPSQMGNEHHVIMTVECPHCKTKHKVDVNLHPVLELDSAPRPKLLHVGDLVLNTNNYYASRAGKEITMSRTEFRLLEFLMSRAGRAASRNEIAKMVWSSNDDFMGNTLDVYIYMLRNKVDRDHKKKLIQTVRGLGYMIRDPTKAYD